MSFRFVALVLTGCAFAALLAGSARAVDPAFTAAPESPITTGSGALGAAAADLNGDGRQDLAIANQGDNNVSILLGDGDGTFTNAPGSPVSVGTDPVAVVAANLNGTGGLDLAVANENLTGTGTVSILLGNGDGTFGTPSSVTTGPIGSGPQSIAVGNLNGADGLDLAVAHENDTGAPGFVTILFGNGSGGFPTSSTVTVGNLPQAVVAGNFNGDGNTDLAVANEASGNVSILFGNGSGGFPSSSTVAAGTDPNAIAAADLNGTGGPDLIVANAGSSNVSILLGNGSGVFSNASGSPVGVGSSPEGIAVADFNADTKLDLAVANAGGTTMSILVGDGGGGFTTAAAVPAGGDPSTPVAANFDAETKPDLAVANYASGDVTVALNTTQTSPTAVTLTAFVARVTPKGVELRWRTAQETGILGFEIYRSGTRLNRTLVPARGSAAAYRLLDRGARRIGTSVYCLRVVRTDGTRAWLGRALVGR